MEQNNYKDSSLLGSRSSWHVISEAIIVGGMSLYLFKKISDLELTVKELKEQITAQNNQIRYLFGSKLSTPPQVSSISSNSSSFDSFQRGTPLRIPSLSDKKTISPPPSLPEETGSVSQNDSADRVFAGRGGIECENGVCVLKPKIQKNNNSLEKKVVISKISKQLEFDRENIDFDQTSNVNTFTNFSPNPVIKSVTPKPSISLSETSGISEEHQSELEKILNDIDDE